MSDQESLEKELKSLRDEANAFIESPYLARSIKSLIYEVWLDRTAVAEHELGRRINEKHGTMFEIKQQARKMAHLAGLDLDNVRLMVTEAVQNILEHGAGKYVQVHLELRNDVENPCMICQFKHEIEPADRYTLRDVEANVLKGDVASEFFDFESHRGRGEFIMKQLTDERRIINGIEIGRDGHKTHYFKRILINYKNPSGPRMPISLTEIKEQIDRLGLHEPVCCFLIQHAVDQPDVFTVALPREKEKAVHTLMESHGFKPLESENYFSSVFLTYVPSGNLTTEEAHRVFEDAKHIVYGD
jgi:anti-sigma regulatory factor (Ser/Thr protein kinase)